MESPMEGRADGQPATEDDLACVLISRMCTTGWVDAINGDLWLCPGGLLRVSLGLGTTIKAGFAMEKYRVDQASRPRHVFAPEERTRLVGLDRKNRWIPWDEVVSLTLRSAIVSHVIEFELASGLGGKLDWIKGDGGPEILEPKLRGALGTRFKRR